jgi:CRP/FNR family transcriptional regulator, cyclic AMP receptor protein
MVPTELLSGLPLFRDSSPQVISALAKRGVDVRYPPNAVLFLTGAPAAGWFIIVEGTVRVVRGSGSRQHVIHTETVGGTLGEVPLFTQGRHPATGIASEPTRCVLFERSALEAAIAEAPSIAFLLASRLAFRAERLVERLHERSATNVQTRVIEFLLARRPARGVDTISIGMTQQALAEDLGTVREVVARELRALVKRGWVESLGGGRYRIRDVKALRAAVAANAR